MTDNPNATPAPRKAGAKDVFKALGRGRVLITLLLGFGSGLPFLLTGATLSIWLAEGDVTLAAIGFISWVGLAYSFKFVWAPVVDRFDVPLIGRFGRRRGWMLLSQFVVGAALVAMALIGPEGGLTALGAAALVTAFASATQDIAVDAWRIESAENDEDMGLLTSAFQLGYKFAILAGNALILFFASWFGWNGAYAIWGGAMVIAIGATLCAKEPVDRREIAAATGGAAPWTPRGMFDAVIGPFINFVKTHKAAAFLMLAAISLYRLPDFVMGPMVGPFYIDLGLTKEAIGAMRLSVGLVAAFVGIAAGGLSAVRFGFGPTLLLGALIGPLSNLGYTAMAVAGLSTPMFAGVLFVENFSEGFAGAALVAYMSSLTGIGYTATQYALLSSFYALLGKFLKGFSGVVVEGLEQGHTLMNAYALFFAGTAMVGIPAVILCWFLERRNQRLKREAEAGT
ncbi:MAG: AmpG family muropeptide MFS transporter [Brevundimonas sp.]|uniref:AmpG family muropeptide MFS transporter n=1 Tax=Brevundimonas sp. TaxID=1871086 RepID=UPI0040333072